MRALITLALLSAPAWAQIAAPLLGYVPDGTRLRAVYGMPASASVMPVTDSREFASAVVSPRQDFVLAIARDGGQVSLLKPDLSSTPLAGMSGVNASPDAIVLSPSGRAAVLWFSSAHKAQVVKGLPDSPAVRDINAAFLDDSPAALAIGDDGEWLAGSWALGTYAIGPQGEVNRLPIEEAVTALAFLSGSRDLVAASSQNVYKVSDVGGRNLATRLAASTGAAKYAAVSRNNRRAILAGASGQIASIALDNALETGEATMVDCGCAPEGLFALGRNSFRLTSLRFGAFKLFDADTGEVLFAPLTAEEGARQ